jgi:hypothetical protein
LGQRKVLQPGRSGSQHRDGVLAAFARKQSRRLGDEPVQTLSVVKTYQHRQLDTQRMKNALRSPPCSGTADVFCRQNSKFARLCVQEGFFFPGTKPLHEHAPAMTGAWWTEGVPLSSPLSGIRNDADAEAR